MRFQQTRRTHDDTADRHEIRRYVGADIGFVAPDRPDQAGTGGRAPGDRQGLPYGPLLPDNSPDDGVDRGLAVFFGCADLERQFEFVLKEWINAPKFQGLLHDKDPIAGDHDGTHNMTVQSRPIKKTLHGLPRFTTVRGGAYVLLPGLSALRSLGTAQ